MSRTYRRRGQRHDCDRVLRDHDRVSGVLTRFQIDARSKEGRRALARFHSDAYSSLRSSAPHWYRRTFNHQQRTLNVRQLRRWLDDPSYDPLFDVRHRHSANWSWW